MGGSVLLEVAYGCNESKSKYNEAKPVLGFRSGTGQDVLRGFLESSTIHGLAYICTEKII